MRRWVILRDSGRKFTSEFFATKGKAKAFLRSIGKNPAQFKFDKVPV